MSLPAFLLLTDTAENRTLCRARALSKREAFVASWRGRRQAAEAGADLRSKYADSPRKASTGYRFDADRTAACHAPHQRRPRRKIHPRIPAQTGMRFPDDVSSGNCIPESTLGMGFIFRKTPQAESSSRNPRSERVALSQRRSKRKRIPESRLKLGHAFRSIFSTPKPMRPPFQNWVEESQNAIAGGQYDCRR